MKSIRLGLTLCAVLAASSMAKADIILINGTPAASFIDLGGTGFGAAPRMLTLQTDGFESGFETPVDVEHGDAINGDDKSTTPTISSLGWDNGASVGIGFNSNQKGSESGAGITLQTLVLTLYNGTSAVGSFSLAAPIQFNPSDLGLQQGNGNAVFAFGLDNTQQTTFNTLVGTYGTSLYAGLGASLGCETGAPAGCQSSNDGADSFLGFDRETVSTPDGGPTVFLLGFGLLGLVQINRKLRA